VLFLERKKKERKKKERKKEEYRKPCGAACQENQF
jgi:hypothetical protein